MAESWRRAAIWVTAGAAVACTSYERELAEFDSVTRIDAGMAWPEEVSYRADPARLSWIGRRLASFGPTNLLLEAFDVRPVSTEMENPSGFARTSALWLTDFAAGDLMRTAQVVPRLLWMLDVDTVQPLNRAIAVTSLERLIGALGFDPRKMRLPDPAVTTEARVAKWLATMRASWPTAREHPLDERTRAAYIEALEQMTVLPQVGRADRRTLIVALGRGLAAERDPRLVGPTRDALQRALYHGVAMGMQTALSAESPLVRVTAMRALHRLGGDDVVPFLLALIAKPPSTAALNRFDEDPFVRMTLVRMCAQLDRQRAHESWGDGPAPVELLYETALLDPARNLRQAALEGLALVLGRPVDFDSDWAEQWWREDYIPRRGAGPPRPRREGLR